MTITKSGTDSSTIQVETGIDVARALNDSAFASRLCYEQSLLEGEDCWKLCRINADTTELCSKLILAAGDGLNALMTPANESEAIVSNLPMIHKMKTKSHGHEHNTILRGHSDFLKQLDITPLMILCLDTLQSVNHNCSPRGHSDHCQKCAKAAQLAQTKITQVFPQLANLKEFYHKEVKSKSLSQEGIGSTHASIGETGEEIESPSGETEGMAAGSPEQTAMSGARTRGRVSTMGKKEKEPTTPKKRRMTGEAETATALKAEE